MEAVQHARLVIDIGNCFGALRVRLLLARMPGSALPVYVVDAPYLYRRAGGPYQDRQGEEWPDNLQRFALLGWVAAHLAGGDADLQWQPEVVHAHDWHAAMACAFIADHAGTEATSIFTIHNLAFQGLFPLHDWPLLGLETEVFAYGRMPLAFSARCFTARQRNLPKDDCRFSCLDHPDGLMLNTREHEGFLVLNGTQTQSAKVYNLVDALDDMRSLGVDVVRLSPQSQNMADVVAVFDAARKHTLSPQDALARLQPLMPFEGCNGYWHGQPGLDQVHSDTLAEQD